MLTGNWKYIFNNSINIKVYYPDSPGGYKEDGEVWTMSSRRGESMRRGGQLQIYLCNLTPWNHEKPVYISNTCSLKWQPSLWITVFIIDNGIFILLIFHFFCTIWHISPRPVYTDTCLQRNWQIHEQGPNCYNRFW